MMSNQKFMCVRCLLFKGAEVVKLPIRNGELVIPNKINDNEIIEITSAPGHKNCECRDNRYEVEKITFKCKGAFINNFINDFDNLKELAFEYDVYLQVEDVDYCDQNVEKITFGRNCTIDGFREVFKKPLKISIVDIRFNIEGYTVEMFKNCRWLQPSWVLKEGVVGIEDGAFDGCEYFSEINLPKSLRYLHIDAFKNCKHIEKFKLNSYIVFDNSSSMNVTDKAYRNLLADSKYAVVYCPEDFPVNYLKKYLAPHVKIERTGKIYPSSRSEMSVEKFKVLGLGRLIQNIPETMEDLAMALELMDEDIWRKQIIREVIDVLKKDSIYNARIVGDGIFFVKVKIEYETKISMLDYVVMAGSGDDISLFSGEEWIELNGDKCFIWYKVNDDAMLRISFLIDKYVIVKIIREEVNSGGFKDFRDGIKVRAGRYAGIHEAVLGIRTLAELIPSNLIIKNEV